MIRQRRIADSSMLDGDESSSSPEKEQQESMDNKGGPGTRTSSTARSFYCRPRRVIICLLSSMLFCCCCCLFISGSSFLGSQQQRRRALFDQQRFYFQNGTEDKAEELTSSIAKDHERTLEERGKNATAVVALEELRWSQVQKQEKRAKLNAARKKNVSSSILNVRLQALLHNASLSACLLIKDDNDILREWLAYHYHAAKLRHLIVAVDPTSVDSPNKILDQWHTQTDMNIVIWKDRDYMPGRFLTTGKALEFADFPNLTKQELLAVQQHRYRQKVFLLQCLKKFKRDGNTFVATIDSDEYLVVNKWFQASGPDYVDIPPLDRPNSIFHVLQQVAEKSPSLINYPCLMVRRLSFGSIEYNNTQTDTRIRSAIPDALASFVDASRFETLRWRFHAANGAYTLNGNPKTILDVSAIPVTFFPRHKAPSIHRPINEICLDTPGRPPTAQHSRYPIVANHYLGSWERYSLRQDSRRSKAVYNSKAFVNSGMDERMLQWLAGFADKLGIDLSRKLLLGE